MKFAFLTPGTGSYYCGACMRDNALAKSLVEAGHEVSLLPMYLPLQLDEEAFAPSETPIFFGGINVYLQQKLPFFRKTPAWIDKLFNSTGLLRAAAKRSHMTSPREHGEMALAMLEIEDSPFDKETEKLLEWLERDPPGIVVLSNALLAGFTRSLRRRLNCKVIACFQGEDSFLDGLPEPFRTRCWESMEKHLGEADLLISPSQFYADLMRRRFNSPDLTIEVMPNGVTLGRAGFQPASEPRASNSAAQPPDSSPHTSHADRNPDEVGGSAPGTAAKRPTIGYLARMIREKGVSQLVDAFIHLRNELKHPDARLHIAGTATDGDAVLVNELKQRLSAAGLSDEVTWSPNIDHDEKTALLESFSLFSVPATYPEAFGLYTIEALAAGTPLVMPESSSFPEIVRQSDAGRLSKPQDPVSLAETWHDLLNAPDELQRLSENARRAAEDFYSVEAMRERFLKLAQPLTESSS